MTQGEEKLEIVQDTALVSILESILLVSEKPVSVVRFQEAFAENPPNDEGILEAIETLRTKYSHQESGIELRQSQGGFQLVTRVANVEYIRRFQASKPFRLGKSALETLAVIAYRQPVTRAEIDQIRGIDSSHLLRTLMERGLVKMAGKSELPGRPVQYGTTPKFLEIVGLNTLNELPPLTELEQIQGHTEDHLKKIEEGLDRLIQNKNVDTFKETLEEQNQGLAEIQTLLENAEGGTREIFASPIHAEAAQENQAALEAFQAQKRPRRKPKQATVNFEELTLAPME